MRNKVVTFLDKNIIKYNISRLLYSVLKMFCHGRVTIILS